MPYTKPILIASVLCAMYALLPAQAAADEVYGRVWLSGSKSGATGATVVVAGVGTTTVDDTGHYRLGELKSGWVKITITYQERESEPVSVKISGRTRASFELIPPKSGSQWTARRR